MKFCARSVCVFAMYALVHGSVGATEQKLWLYPCDVYMSSSCIHLPSGMSASYQVPADYGIYTVSASGKDLVSIYAGSAPDRPGGRPTLKLDSPVATLTGFIRRDNGLNKVDLLISPKGDHVSTVHVFALFSDEQRSDVARVVSSLRACRKPDREELWCPQESPWGEALRNWVSGIPSG